MRGLSASKYLTLVFRTEMSMVHGESRSENMQYKA
jgi:hypothetical protein